MILMEVEVEVGEGGLLERPQRVKPRSTERIEKLAEQVEQAQIVVPGTTDEDMVLRELDQPPVENQLEQIEITQEEPMTLETLDKIENEQPVEAKIEQGQTVLLEKEATPDIHNKELQTEEPIQDTVTSQYTIQGFKTIEQEDAGRTCAVDRVKNKAGLEFALKRINEGLTAPQHTRARKRLESEARLINKLAAEGSLYTPRIAMDFGIDGIIVEYGPESLARKIREGLDMSATLELLPKMADPIIRMHDKGKTLLDIKPRNYRLREDGDPIFVDFESGTKRKAADISQTVAHSLEVSGEVDSGSIFGTLLYMAPEMIEGRVKGGQEIQADVFSLGATFYECLAGKRLTIGSKKLSRVGRLVDELGETKATELSDLISRATSEEVSERPQTVTEFVEEYESIVELEKEDAVQTSEAELQLRSQVDFLKHQLAEARTKPSRVEVIASEKGKANSGSVAVESVKTTMGIAGKVCNALSYVPGSIFAIPSTVMRKSLNKDLELLPFIGFGSLTVTFGGMIATGAALDASAGSTLGYTALTLLATNAISGGVEVVRHSAKKVKAREAASPFNGEPSLRQLRKKAKRLIRHEGMGRFRLHGSSFNVQGETVKIFDGGYDKDLSINSGSIKYYSYYGELANQGHRLRGVAVKDRDGLYHNHSIPKDQRESIERKYLGYVIGIGEQLKTKRLERLERIGSIALESISK